MRIRIETEDKRGKGRSFSTELLAYVRADHLWEGGQTDTLNLRPVWWAFAGTQQETRMFWFNLVRGRPAQTLGRNNQRFEALKTAGYHYHISKVGDGVVYFAYLPDLFVINPGMVDEDFIRFCLLPSRKWLASQPPTDVGALHRYLERVDMAMEWTNIAPMKGWDPTTIEATALLFLLYLDRRTRQPIPNDSKFAVQLLLRSEQAGFTKRHINRYARTDYAEHGLDQVGLSPGFAFSADHESFYHFLSQEIRVWHALNQ